MAGHVKDSDMGEGNYKATRDYNKGVAETVKDPGKIEEAARDAEQALDGEEAAEFERAEAEGRAHAKG